MFLGYCSVHHLQYLSHLIWVSSRSFWYSMLVLGVRIIWTFQVDVSSRVIIDWCLLGTELGTDLSMEKTYPSIRYDIFVLANSVVCWKEFLAQFRKLPYHWSDGRNPSHHLEYEEPLQPYRPLGQPGGYVLWEYQLQPPLFTSSFRDLQCSMLSIPLLMVTLYRSFRHLTPSRILETNGKIELILHYERWGVWWQEIVEGTHSKPDTTYTSSVRAAR